MLVWRFVVCAVLGASVVLGAGSVAKSASHAKPPVSWLRLHRSLLPARLAADGTCPVSGQAATVGGRPLVGRNPVFLFIVGDATAGEIEVGPPDADGWRGQKTPWLTDSHYQGPILIRGRAVGTEAPVSFAKVYGQHLDELRYIAGGDSRVSSDPGGTPGSYAFRPSTTAFRTLGCYALQIDGKHFTRQLIVRVTASGA
jgi:hypothetical protein